jgi:hypothetical protein
VVAAGTAGRLPARLDGDGLRHALDLLIADPQPTPAGKLRPRYYRLAELPGMRVLTAATVAIEAAPACGVTPARVRGDYDVAEILRGWASATTTTA